jgi:hypothetical protein
MLPLTEPEELTQRKSKRLTEGFVSNGLFFPYISELRSTQNRLDNSINAQELYPKDETIAYDHRPTQPTTKRKSRQQALNG